MNRKRKRGSKQKQRQKKTNNMKRALSSIDKDKFLELVAEEAKLLNIQHLGIDIVASALFEHPELANPVKGKINSNREVIKKWVATFEDGYKNRISQKISKTPGTKPDPAINRILQAALPCIDKEKLTHIQWAHRLAMSAENILGLLLEEYIFSKLGQINHCSNTAIWSMAWGKTVKKVDFCSNNGDLLQIKNRSNSENSSSKKIREGTKIQLWYRINCANGKTRWDDLCKTMNCNSDIFTEEDFYNFIEVTISNNKNALAIENENPYIKYKNPVQK